MTPPVNPAFEDKLDSLVDANLTLRDALLGSADRSRKGDRLRTLLLIVLCVIAVLNFVAVVKVYDVATTSEAGRRDGRRTLNGLVDCTQPSPVPPPPPGTPDTRKPADIHVCSERGGAQMATAIAAVIDTNGNGIADIDELAAALGVPLPTTTTTTLGGNR